MKVAILVCLVGCSAVPDVRYVDADGATEAGRDATSEAATSDAATCAKIEVADICCDSSTCRGDCSAANCATCTSKCKSDELCCAKANNVVCKARTSPSCN